MPPTEGPSVSTVGSTETSFKRRLIKDKNADCAALDITPPLFVCAPMVRYTKLHFRKLVKLYGCDISYTPMIYASNFIASEKCRANEFTTDDRDFPVVQFAANKPEHFAEAAELVYGQVKGIDLNCGCPKSDVRSDGFGSKLLEDPQLIADIVKQTRARISDPEFTVSVKIRILQNMDRTIQAAGVSHVGVHGRTVSQRSEPADYEAIGLIKSALDVPVYANGGCASYEDALQIAAITKADGVMVAEGLLNNPALFGGHEKTPVECVKDWVRIGTDLNVHYTLFHRHTAFMTSSLMNKHQRLDLQKQATVPDTISYLNQLFCLG